MDFYQNGIITTLHNLVDRPLEEMEADLKKFSKKRPLGLVLPSLYSELQTPALKTIVEELKSVDYLEEIIIGLDRADESEYRHALEFFSVLPQNVKVIWNDGPRMKAIHKKLVEEGIAPEAPGKGRNVWYMIGYVLGSNKVESVALHDCDIVTYDRSLLAKLIYPVANPQFNYDFAKGFYTRIANQTMNGRVTRLLVTPLIRALQKTAGEVNERADEYLSHIDSYRYPLAGEFAFRKGVISDLRIPSDWGLEIGVLSEMKRNISSNRICQVDIADIYDHKHQDLSAEDAKKGLSKMSIDISKAFFRKLAAEGVTFTEEGFRSLKATYYRIALDLIESYRNDAIMNGLTLDVHKEECAVELFSENIIKAGKHFLESPMETPFIPSWNRVSAAFPDIMDDIIAAVDADMQQYAK
ncbi:glycosyl transferase [Thiomicrorhabdus sediminis]|uniref:Glycosyl transferase n=1 Tax=Thiomicrorhabdus sediminis TaxID=2580412 RepID=A0A4P9K7S5_9GAMM|nr:glycosyl transferase [Thiomicrorhabdus sediminis]QCU91008.1 glycosyl transferase [Thiomicrorhabdus sediminis]